MSEDRYDIIYKGEIREGWDVRTVKTNIAGLFKVDPSKIKRFFSGKPVPVKKNVDPETAGKFQNAFKKAGAVCYLVPCNELKQKTESPSPRQGKNTPNIIRPVFSSSGSVSDRYAPVNCDMLTAWENGININRLDVDKIHFSRIQLISVFMHNKENFFLFFTKDSERPYLINTQKIRYPEFPGVKGGNSLISLKNFIVFLLKKNPKIILDEATYDFIKTKNIFDVDKWLLEWITALAAEKNKDASPPEPGGSSSPNMPDASSVVIKKKQADKTGHADDHEETNQIDTDADEEMWSVYWRISAIFVILLAGIGAMFSISPFKSLFAAPFFFFMAYLAAYLLRSKSSIINIGLWSFLTVVLIFYGGYDYYAHEQFNSNIVGLWAMVSILLLLKYWPPFITAISKPIFNVVSFKTLMIICLIVSGTLFYVSPEREEQIEQADRRDAAIKGKVETKVVYKLLDIRRILPFFYSTVEDVGEEFPETIEDFNQMIVDYGDYDLKTLTLAPYDKTNDQSSYMTLFIDTYTKQTFQYDIIGNRDRLIPDFEFRSAGPDAEYGTEDDFIMQGIDRDISMNEQLARAVEKHRDNYEKGIGYDTRP